MVKPQSGTTIDFSSPRALGTRTAKEKDKTIACLRRCCAVPDRGLHVGGYADLARVRRAHDEATGRIRNGRSGVRQPVVAGADRLRPSPTDSHRGRTLLRLPDGTRSSADFGSRCRPDSGTAAASERYDVGKNGILTVLFIVLHRRFYCGSFLAFGRLSDHVGHVDLIFFDSIRPPDKPSRYSPNAERSPLPHRTSTNINVNRRLDVVFYFHGAKRKITVKTYVRRHYKQCCDAVFTRCFVYYSFGFYLKKKMK